MTIYLLVFLGSLLSLKVAEKKQNKKTIFFFWCAVAVLLPSVLAGMRAEGVGFDTALYGVVAYEYSLSHSLSDLLAIYGNDSPLFYIIWYYNSSVFKTIFAQQFVLEFLIEILIVGSLVKLLNNKEIKNVWVGFAVYLFVFYSYSLNIMRQSLALALVLFAIIVFLREKKILKYFICIIISMLIHTSGFLGFVIWILYTSYYSQFYQNTKRRFIYYSFMVGLVLAFLVGYTRILSFVSIFLPRYEHYASTNIKVRSTFDALTMFTMVALFIIISSLFLSRRNRKSDFLQVLVIMGIPIFLINLYSNDTYRLSFYFLYCMIPLAPLKLYANNASDNEKINIRFLKLVLVFVLMFFWYVMFVKWGTNKVIPYETF